MDPNIVNYEICPIGYRSRAHSDHDVHVFQRKVGSICVNFWAVGMHLLERGRNPAMPNPVPQREPDFVDKMSFKHDD